MVSGHEDRNQLGRVVVRAGQVVASMVSGHEDRNQPGVSEGIHPIFSPQWCPAMKTGISRVGSHSP